MKTSFWFPWPHGTKGFRVCHPSHGPQTWPWWKLFSPSVVDIGVQEPSSGKRLWVYTRWGAVHFDIYFNRREAA